MPVAMTFSSLQSDLRAYLERGSVSDPTVYAQLPSIINNAERRISSELKILGFIVPANFTFQAGVAVIAKPDRWRETVSINVGSAVLGTIVRKQIYPRSYEYIRSYWPNEAVTAPGPLFYADYNFNNWVFAPTPDLAYPAEVMYYEEPALLDATNTTNWITIYKPQLLLYSALLECEPFLKNDDRIPVWQSMYDRAAGVTDQENKEKAVDRTTIRNKD